MSENGQPTRVSFSLTRNYPNIGGGTNQKYSGTFGFHISVSEDVPEGEDKQETLERLQDFVQSNMTDAIKHEKAQQLEARDRREEGRKRRNAEQERKLDEKIARKRSAKKGS